MIIDEIRARLLEKLRDLNEKILTNEPMPHKEQSLEFLIDIDDKLEECLNNWYY